MPIGPIITKSIDGKPFVIEAVLFDGTSNDREKVPKNSRQTIEGHIYDNFKNNGKIYRTVYKPGVGTENNFVLSKLDGAIGYSAKEISESAVSQVVQDLEEIIKQKPDSEIRIFVSGFSRGAATARDFMNRFEKRWAELKPSNNLPRFYAILFDSVATGQESVLQLQIPKTVDSLYNFISRDERRFLFSVVLDDPQNDPDGRYLTVLNPGVHSDIGASYSDGIGSEYLSEIDAVLSSMGLIDKKCFIVNLSARLQGKHDSRWPIDVALGTDAPDSAAYPPERGNILVKPVPLSPSEKFYWEARLKKLNLVGNSAIGSCILIHDYGEIKFTVDRYEKKYRVMTNNEIFASNPIIYSLGSKYFIKFGNINGSISNVPLSNKVLSVLNKDNTSELSLGETSIDENNIYLWWFVNNIRVDKIKFKAVNK